ncbi:Stk1 family PASTA domain-containing Ser/Thr kinase [Nonomuraea soli]|uniref:non-specific serine/threonine protein kinase n=1 Tax=Nonomuraea soli TaxID=1032476 RepID=A0A7W0CIA4_9ACTN|nr:Stk1 family PASTA domain-containing Ser/Thr kinase [Nonomuraea soli]MBA2891696.1 serine/threonine-protein kinase [Nonomuraea soli]
MTQPRLLGGRYELDGVVGRGGMAEVYRARDIRLDRIVAIKTLRSDLARDHTFQARFRREAQSAASLNHPAVVAVYDTGEDSSEGAPVPYIVMEYVDGRTLRDLLRQDRHLMPERAAELVDGILRALDYSHRGGIVHRDIKPANVMITRNGDVKVMDFGIARAMADSAATMTQTAQVIGTAQYLSPEQARGERVDARSDIYSTGCVFYELLTGQPPFTGDSPVAIAYQHVREEPIPPSQINPEIPRWADAIVLKAMAKDPAHRYQSAAEMRADIQRAMTGQPVDAQTMAMATSGTRMMTSTQAGPATGRTSAIPPYEYGDGQGGGRGGRRRAAGGGGGGKVARTLAWILIPLLIIGAFIGVGYYFLSSNNGGTEDPTKVAKVAVPNVAGQTKDEAQGPLSNAKLVVGDTTMENSTEYDKGQIIKTDPPSGTEVDQGTKINLIVSDGPAKVTVPADLVGMKQEDALKALDDAGLKGQVKQRSSSKPQGTVIATDPKPGTEVSEGKTVTLFVPSARVEVPDVAQWSQKDAEKELKGLGFKVTVVEQASPDIPAGSVIMTNPPAGTQLPTGGSVTLVISTGPDTQPTEEPSPDPTETDPWGQPTDDPGDGQPEDNPEDQGGG